MTPNQATEGVLARCAVCGEQRLVFIAAGLMMKLEARRAPEHCKTCKGSTVHWWQKGRPRD